MFLVFSLSFLFNFFLFLCFSIFVERPWIRLICDLCVFQDTLIE